MKLSRYAFCPLAALTLTCAGAAPLSLDNISQRLASVECYADTCTYEVLLATLSEPVSYTVALRSALAATPDTLAPCDYYIQWSMPTPTGISSGFSAYFEGNHFRYRDQRLQEYHATESLEPFAPGGDMRRGVQSQVQFADLLPAFIGRKFADMSIDSTYIYTIEPEALIAGRNATVIKGVRRISGFDCTEYVYILDPETFLPRRIELENNPGQIGEQSLVIEYRETPSPMGSDCSINFDKLLANEGEAFEKYRESTFSLETLPGRMLPEISAPTTTAERYFHARGEGFAAPTILVFLDSAVDSTPAIIADVRTAIASMPMQIDVIWAFLDHRAEDVESVITCPLAGEHLLMHAGSAARDCGVGTLTPVIVFTGRDGMVRDFITGYNQQLPSLVIEKASLLQ